MLEVRHPACHCGSLPRTAAQQAAERRSVIQPSATMIARSGSCHCGTVRFRCYSDASHLVRCSCSLCAVKGALYLPVDQVESVEILSGEAELTSYRFNTMAAEHLFCRRCGIHPFHRPRIDPSRWSVNALCLDDGAPDLPIEDFDGKNWEAAVQADRDSKL